MKSYSLFPALLLFLFVTACSSKKQTVTTTSPENGPESKTSNANYYSYQQDTLKFLVKGQKDSTVNDQPLQVILKMETAKIGNKDYSFYQTREFKLDRESEFINFDNVIGIKFFRTSVTEFGQLKNYYKYQVLIFEKGQWKVSYDNQDMHELSISKKRSSNLSREGTTVSSTSAELTFAFSFSFLKTQ